MPRKKEIVPEKISARSISASEKQEAIRRMEDSIRLSPVLSVLQLHVSPRGAHFHLDYVSEEGKQQMARVTPMQGSPAYALEYKSADGWALYGQGTPSRVIKLLCNDTLGTFHCLGSIDQTLRNTASGKPPEIAEHAPRQFSYQATGYNCTLHEALHFYFEIPLEVLLEPREWYEQHAEPSLLAVGKEGTRILVRFCDRKAEAGRILGHCLYAWKRSMWWALPLPEDEGNTLEEAEKHFREASG